MAGTQGTVIWFEIWVSDMERARAFYSGLFGWKFSPLSEYDAEGNYQEIDAGAEAGVNGALVLQPGRERPGGRGSVLYVHVADLEEAAAKAVALGGRLVRERTPIAAGMGSFVLVADTEGNDLGLWVP
jgi:uncharacterized protein